MDTLFPYTTLFRSETAAIWNPLCQHDLALCFVGFGPPASSPAKGPRCRAGGRRHRACRSSCGLRQIEPVGVHHLGPGRDEIAHELGARVRRRIAFGYQAQLRLRTEAEVRDLKIVVVGKSVSGRIA